MACPIHSLKRMPFLGSASYGTHVPSRTLAPSWSFFKKCVSWNWKRKHDILIVHMTNPSMDIFCHIFCHDSSCEITETSAELQFPLSEMESIKKWDFPSGRVSASEAHWPQLLLAFSTMVSFVLTCWQITSSSLPSFLILYTTGQISYHLLSLLSIPWHLPSEFF